MTKDSKDATDQNGALADKEFAERFEAMWSKTMEKHEREAKEKKSKTPPKNFHSCPMFDRWAAENEDMLREDLDF